VGAISFIYLLFINRRELRGFYLPTMFMNSGNMALPLTLLAFGEEGLAYAVIYYVTVGILVYTLGIYIAKGEGGWKEVLRLPLLYSVVAGLYLNINHVELPQPIFNAIDILGEATIPMMLLSLGFRLKSIKLSYLSISLTGSVIRIFGGILVAYLIVSATDISDLAQKVILLSSAMPAAVINFVVTEKYHLQSDLVASIVFLSTILSIFSTPIILVWIMN
jgi:predicted permease